MAELVRIFEHLGCVDVRTYIQSGNVIFRAATAHARRIPQRVSHEIAERLNPEES